MNSGSLVSIHRIPHTFSPIIEVKTFLTFLYELVKKHLTLPLQCSTLTLDQRTAGTPEGMKMIQLPDDVKSVGYKQSTTNRFEYEQVFYSKSNNFTGTEAEFVETGIGYKYVQLNHYTRRVI